jgi:hypothetical protein
MRLPTVALGLAAAGLFACGGSDSRVATTTTTTAPRVAPTTSTTTADVPEPAAAPKTAPERFVRVRPRPPRPPRVPRQAIRAQLAAALAARRPDRPLPTGELELLTNKAMQIRVMRSRLNRLRPELQQTPRADKLRERLAIMLDEFQTKAGVPASDLAAILEPPPEPPRDTLRRGG